MIGIVKRPSEHNTREGLFVCLNIKDSGEVDLTFFDHGAALLSDTSISSWQIPSPGKIC